MLNRFPIITFIILIPFIGAFFTIFTKDNRQAIFVSLWTSFFVLACLLGIMFQFDFSLNGMSYIHTLDFFSSNGFKYIVGMDKISILWCNLIAITIFFSILWLSHTQNTKKITIPLLIFEAFAMGACCADNIFLMFFCLESAILSLIMLNKHHTSQKEISNFFIYLSCSSIILLIALIMLYIDTNSSNIVQISSTISPRKCIFWLFMLSISLKIPFFPFHNWLPKIYSSSSTICSILLVTIMAQYNLLLITRFILPIFQDIFYAEQNLLIIVCIISMLAIIFKLKQQDNIKTFFAYIAVFHMNMFFLTLICHAKQKYFIFSLIQHIFVITIIFFTTHIIKSIFKTNSLTKIQQLKHANIKIILLPIFLIFMSVPLSPGFICEILCLYHLTQYSIYYAIILIILIVTVSAITIGLYQSIFATLSSNKNNINFFYSDNIYRKITIYMLLLFILLLGIYPDILLSRL